MNKNNTPNVNWDKTTKVYNKPEDSLWENNVGGCQNLFFGVCEHEFNEQSIPCIFCPHKH